MFTLIESIDDLAVLNEELLRKHYVGVDTEFRRTNKDNMRLALLQVNDGEETYLIDTLCIKEPEDRASFLFSNAVVKIFHSCKEDLEAIYSWTNKQMLNIFDTQLANSFLNGEYSISYQALVQEKLDIILEKKETRSNWLRRPLSDDQLKYASLDVEYLIFLYEEQREELIKAKKMVWLDQDIRRLVKLTFNPQDFLLDLKRTLSKSEENKILQDLNKVIITISEENEINETLFFSKKAQKDLLRSTCLLGLDEACNQITPWRSKLIKKDLINLLN